MDDSGLWRATPDQRERHESFVRDFPVGQCVRYLPTNGVMGRVREVYWDSTFWETWIEVEVWDIDSADFRELHNLPAMLFIQQEEEYCAPHDEGESGEETATS